MEIAKKALFPLSFKCWHSQFDEYFLADFSKSCCFNTHYFVKKGYIKYEHFVNTINLIQIQNIKKFSWIDMKLKLTPVSEAVGPAIAEILPKYDRPWYKVRHLLNLNLLLIVPLFSSATAVVKSLWWMAYNLWKNGGHILGTLRGLR